MYNATCVITGKKDNLRMHASRNTNGDMTGWVFLHESIDVESVKANVDYQFEAKDSPELRVTLHDPELKLVVHEEITSEPSPYKFKKGDRVKNLKFENEINIGATGTVDENDKMPFVIWDSLGMVTENAYGELRRCQREADLELITEPEIKPIEFSEAHSSIVLDELQNRVSGEALEMAQPDYSHLIGKWVRYCLKGLEDKPFFGKWAQIKQVEDMGGSIEIWINELDVFGDLHHGSFTNDLHGTCFDLSNPRDTNPDEPVETRIPFDPSRMKDAIRYETRDGREVKSVVLNDVESDRPITGYLENNPTSWRVYGIYDATLLSVNSESDLFMVVIKGGEE